MTIGELIAWETTDGDIYTGILEVYDGTSFLARVVSCNGTAERHPARYESVTVRNPPA